MSGVVQFIIIVEIAKLRLPVCLETGQFNGGGAQAEGEAKVEGSLEARHCVMLDSTKKGIDFILQRKQGLSYQQNSLGHFIGGIIYIGYTVQQFLTE